MSVNIVPALLTDNEEELIELQEKLSFAPLVQLDIMDGKFVPSQSVSIEILQKNTFKNPFEVHLMTQHPESYFKIFKNMGAKGVIFHVESTDDICFVIGEAKALGLEVSLAINPDTPHSELKAYVDIIDSVLFMTVYPGFYGAKFEPKVLDKIKSFKELYPHIRVAIDGGAKEENVKLIAAAGVDTICVGSAIARAESPQQTYERLLEEANS